MHRLIARLPLRGPWSIAPGDVVLVVTGVGIPPGGRAGDCERYARVVSVRRRVRSRRVVALTTALARLAATRETLDALRAMVALDGGERDGCGAHRVGR